MNDREGWFTLLGIGVGGAVTVVATEGDFDLWDILVGVVLLFLLRAYDEGGPTKREKLAFAAVWALCVVLVAAYPIQMIVTILHIASTVEDPSNLVSIVGILLWGVLTLIRCVLISAKGKDKREDTEPQ